MGLKNRTEQVLIRRGMDRDRIRQILSNGWGLEESSRLMVMFIPDGDDGKKAHRPASQPIGGVQAERDKPHFEAFAAPKPGRFPGERT